MNNIIPLFIYHYNSGDNFYSVIEYNNTSLSPSLYKGWYLYGIIYVFSPILKPIPNGTKLFSIERKNHFPYGLTDYKILYNPYDIKRDIYTVSFITYNKPVIHTKPLYFHKLNDNIFVSFDDKPPNNNPKWTLL